MEDNTQESHGISPMSFLSNAMAHYRHARAKHPYFADAIAERSDYYSKVRLNHWRAAIELEKRIGHVRALTLLQCEIAEALDAHERCDTAHAVEECYDTIAVLMRMIDVMEGRQPLGDRGSASAAPSAKRTATEEAK